MAATNNADNTGAVVAVARGGTGAQEFVPYAPLCGGLPAPIGRPGSALTSNGAGVPPIWATPAMTLLRTISVGGAAQAVFTSSDITTAHSVYILTVNHVTNFLAGNLQFTFSTDGGSTFLESGYVAGRFNLTTSDSAFGSAVTTTAFGQLTSGFSTTGTPSKCIAYFFMKPGGPTSWVGNSQAGNPTMLRTYGYHPSGTVNGLRIRWSAGNSGAGSVSLYGLKS